MKKTLELTADQLHEVVRGLDLRVSECEKMLKRSKGAQAQREWDEQLQCARSTLLRAEEMQSGGWSQQASQPTAWSPATNSDGHARCRFCGEYVRDNGAADMHECGGD